MFEKTLIKGAKENLVLLGKSGLLKDAYLAGGTAVALQLGHRISVDFDFFTLQTFDPRFFADQLSKIGLFEEKQASKGTVLGKFEGVKFSLSFYQHPLLFSTINYASLNVAELRDLAAMKIDAISNRGAKRDFIDLYHICRFGYRLSESLELYDKKYGKLASNLIHLKKSLIYFEDAEGDEMPGMLKKTSWKEVKSFFEDEVKKLKIRRFG